MNCPRTRPVECHLDGSIFHIRLNRPEKGNAINRAMAVELRSAAETCASTNAVRAVLVSARGRHFCAGGDLSEFHGQHEARRQQVRAIANDVHQAQELLLTLNAPVICVVQGDAAGAGLGLALVADFVLAATSATFIAHYASLGLSADGGSTFLLPRLVGLARAREMLLLDRRLSAAEARNWGLVSQVHEPDNLSEAATALAEQLSRGSTPAFGAIKRLLLSSDRRDFRSQVDQETLTITEFSTEPDAEMRIAAFLEKRHVAPGLGQERPS